MAVYRLFLWTGCERSTRWNDVVCDNDDEARDHAQQLLEEWGSWDSQAEIWAGPRLVGMVFSVSAVDLPPLTQPLENWLS